MSLKFQLPAVEVCGASEKYPEGEYLRCFIPSCIKDDCERLVERSVVNDSITKGHTLVIDRESFTSIIGAIKAYCTSNFLPKKQLCKEAMANYKTIDQVLIVK